MRALSLSPNTMGDRYKQTKGSIFKTGPSAADSSQLRQAEETMNFCTTEYPLQVSYHTAVDSLARWEA